MFSRSHDELLSRLEQAEMALLAWGRVDGTLTAEEVEIAASEVVGAEENGDDLIEDLIDCHLLIDVGASEVAYRTRFAESVRLLARNRQLMFGRPWRTAPELVNDFRIVARPRRFPRRDKSVAAVLERLGKTREVGDVEAGALRAMLTTESGELNLASFQLDALEQVRARLSDGSTAGTMVCAGTGSGKTKAFYLPVLSAVAESAVKDSNPWARVIAIYPRNELLKDQITEALAQVDLIAASGGPVISVGAYFGPTAFTAKSLERSGGWKSVDGGYACRYIRCPQGCVSDVNWRDEDRVSGRQILVCPQCGWTSTEGQLSLTRDTLQATPPHVLFTSTEMLNRVLAENKGRKLVVGPSPQQTPTTLLLDEVHTYGGVHGAQVGLLIRRWRSALGNKAHLHVVGLSATLEAPEQFFSDLTGIPDVRVIRPADEDLESRGADYALVLRGNPVSGTALLSTTIQTTFLLARLLESRELRERTGTSGSRVFAFTDNLDVTNRLFWDLRDAELGGRSGGKPLAQLRSEQDGEVAERDINGQIWRLPTLLGRSLEPQGRLGVTRTSSQDAGVDLTSDVIVSTSSLEVGFDDPEVGAVVQHKAPRDDASFLQRKGRAGRLTGMRPWTVVVLSDYGRDRMRYQAYESLFSPTLAPRAIPVDNRHVLKMQAAYALLDWLSERVGFLKARADLSRPSLKIGDPMDTKQRRVAEYLKKVLDDPREERALGRYVRRALGLTAEQTTAVMWESPRALMTSAIPTLLRRLETRWSTAKGDSDLFVKDVPLPEHAPGALFSNLNLPEVEIVAPQRYEMEARVESMPVPQALSEFVPGRSSRRFGVQSQTAWHWVPRPGPDSDGVRRSNVKDWMSKFEEGGTLELPDEVSRPLFRPWRIELELTPRTDDRSNATPVWESSFSPSGEAWSVEIPSSTQLHEIVPSLGFLTHDLGNEVHVTRGVTRVVAETDEEIEASILLVDGSGTSAKPVAVGFAADVDAVCIPIAIEELISTHELSSSAQQALRTSWFEQCIKGDDILRSRASSFSLGWLSSLYLGALAAIAAGDESLDLASTENRMKELGTSKCLLRAMEGIFDVSLAEEGENLGASRLRDLVEEQEVIARVETIAELLVKGDGSLLAEHARQVGVSTIAVAVREAFQRLAPTFDAESLVIDLKESEAGYVDVWLSEPEVGSAGTVEELRRRIAEEPARFARLTANALGRTDLEIVDAEVRAALTLAGNDPDLESAFAEVRSAVGTKSGGEAQYSLREAIRSNGITVEHGVLATLNLRVLRPGSSRQTDAALLSAFGMWEELESRLDLELDARAVAYAASRDGHLDLKQTYSLLWPRGREARGAGFNTFSRFGQLPPADRLVLSQRMRAQVGEVSAGTTSSETEAVEALGTTGVVRLVANPEESDKLQSLVRTLITRAIDVGSVSGHARVIGASRGSGLVSVDMELPEATT